MAQINNSAPFVDKILYKNADGKVQLSSTWEAWYRDAHSLGTFIPDFKDLTAPLAKFTGTISRSFSMVDFTVNIDGESSSTNLVTKMNLPYKVFADGIVSVFNNTNGARQYIGTGFISSFDSLCHLPSWVFIQAISLVGSYRART